MNRRSILTISAMTALGLALLPGAALSQQKSLKDQLVGTWTLVSAENVAPDGTKRQLFGANPKGILTLDAGGRFTQITFAADRSKFKVGDRLQGTPEEYAAAVRGTAANYGAWSVDEASKTITLRIEGSLLPNQDGTEGKRSIVNLTADELRWLNVSAASGGKSENVYKRAR